MEQWTGLIWLRLGPEQGWCVNGDHLACVACSELTEQLASGRFLRIVLIVDIVLTIVALRYEPEGRGFDSRWCHWNFSLT